nr:putative ribonuclease H-like domain-containing protein [Tanacetum cinerariifolium]
EQSDKAENNDKGKSPVVTITGFKDLNEEFAECINNNSNGVNAAGSLVFAAGLNFTNSTNDFSAAGPSNAAMPNLEDLSHNAKDVGAEANINNMESIISVSPIPTSRIHKDHPTSQIIGDLSLTTQTRSMARGVRDQGGISQMFNEDFHTCMFACFLSNKKDERGIVIRNKARLVAQGHTQEEGIDYEEVFAPVARIEAIRLFLAFASFMGFPVYQMYVKSTFLYGTIKKEVYVCQPPGFEDPEYPNKVYKVVKALYGLHQAPRACNNGVSAVGPSVSTVGLDFTNSTNGVSAAGPSVFAIGLNFTNSTNDFSAAGPSNAAKPNLEDLSHNADDVGAKAGTNNMESIISVSPIPTTRIHKDYPTSQIIGDLSSTTQT